MDEFLKDTKGQAILFNGVGSSYLARVLSKNNRIDGTTASRPEKEQADRLKLPNYKVYLVNKFDPVEYEKCLGTYDMVVDTGPGPYRCCDEHYRQFLEVTFKHLKPGGKFYTHKIGVDYESPKIKLPGGIELLNRLLNESGISYSVNTAGDGRIFIYEKN